MVTLLSAEGGSGKSMLLQIMCTTVAAGTPMFGKATQTGATAGLFAEDPDEVLHARHLRICTQYAIDPASVSGRCHIGSFFGHVALLWKDEGRTQLLVDMEEDLQNIPDLALLVIDNAALVYDGDENDRHEVTKFMAMLNGVAYRHDIGMVLSTHKSKSSDGSVLRSASGSTAWVNAARQVLELQQDGNGDDPSLTVRKSNHIKPGERIELAWVGGVLTLKPLGGDAKAQKRADLDNEIKELVTERFRKSDPLSSAPQAKDRYLVSVMARKGFKASEVEAAMLALLDNGILIRTKRTGDRGRGLRVADERPEARGRDDGH
jgi:RecA-family ATPase